MTVYTEKPIYTVCILMRTFCVRYPYYRHVLFAKVAYLVVVFRIFSGKAIQNSFQILNFYAWH